MAGAVDWAGRLPDETWRGIAAHLGWHALTLRSTCAALQQRVLALEELPVAIQLARRLLQHLDGTFGSEHPFPVPRCYDARCCTQHEREALHRAFEQASHRDFFKAMDAFRCTNRAVKSGRPCWQLAQQLKDDDLFWQVVDRRSRRIARLDKTWNGHLLTDDALVDAMRRMRDLNAMHTGTLFRSDEGSSREGYTTSWHAAASKGNLKVLHFLFQECNQPVHARTPDGNNALAHARHALARITDLANESRLPDPRKLPEGLQECVDGFAKCTAFLQTCGLADEPWRDDEASHEPVDSLAPVFGAGP
jgi:hypothetical protein